MNNGRGLFRDECDVHEFREYLTTIRQQGSNLLVTGEVSQTVTNRASRTLFGDDERPRKRVLAVTDAGINHVDAHFPDGVRPDDSNVWIIDRGNRRRSVPAAATESVSTALPAFDGKNGLQELREEIITAVGFYDDTARGLDAAELRLGVDSLSYLVDEHELTALKRFLRSVGTMVKGVRGMGHYHLPMADDADAVRELSPLFEARVELRQRDGKAPDHRWHVPAIDQTTYWVDL